MESGSSVSVHASIREFCRRLLSSTSAGAHDGRAIKRAVATVYDRLLFWDGGDGQVDWPGSGGDASDHLVDVASGVYEMRCSGRGRDADRLEQLLGWFSPSFDARGLCEDGEKSLPRPDRVQLKFLPPGAHQRIIRLENVDAVLSVLMLLRGSVASVASCEPPLCPALPLRKLGEGAGETTLNGECGAYTLFKDLSFSAIAGVTAHFVSNAASFPGVDATHQQHLSHTPVGPHPSTQAQDLLFGAVSHGLHPSTRKRDESGLHALLALPLLSEANHDALDLMSRATNGRTGLGHHSSRSGAHRALDKAATPPAVRGLQKDKAGVHGHGTRAPRPFAESTCIGGADVHAGKAGGSLWKHLYEAANQNAFCRGVTKAGEDSREATAWEGGKLGKDWWEQCGGGGTSSGTVPKPVSEGGVEIFEGFARWADDHASNEYLPSALISHDHLVRDVIFLSLGLSSHTFQLGRRTQAGDFRSLPPTGEHCPDAHAVFRLRADTRLIGIGVSPLKSLLLDLCVAGSHVLRLDLFIQRNRYGRGKVLGSLCGNLGQFLQSYRRQILSLGAQVAKRRAHGVEALPLQQRADIWAQHIVRRNDMGEGGGDGRLSLFPTERTEQGCHRTASKQSSSGPKGQPPLSLLEVYLHTIKLREQLRMLAQLCRCAVEPSECSPGRAKDGAGEDRKRATAGAGSSDAMHKGLGAEGTMQDGSDEDAACLSVADSRKLLSDLYARIERADQVSAAVCRSLFRQSLQPYLDTLTRCIFLAEVEDEYGEFVLKHDKTIPERTEEHYLHAFTLRSESDCPFFLLPLRTHILRTAQGLAVLRACKPSHALCNLNPKELPLLQFRYTLADVQGLQSQHDSFHARVAEEAERAAMTSSREALLAEQAARLAFRERIQGLVRKYRAIEVRQAQAMSDAKRSQAQQREGLLLQAQEHDARKQAATRRERESDKSRVQEYDMYGAQSVEELASLKEHAAQELISEYEQRLEALHGESERAQWTGRRSMLQEERIALAVSDLTLLRDELLMGAVKPPEQPLDSMLAQSSSAAPAEKGGVVSVLSDDATESYAQAAQEQAEDRSLVLDAPPGGAAAVMGADREQTAHEPQTVEGSQGSVDVPLESALRVETGAGARKDVETDEHARAEEPSSQSAARTDGCGFVTGSSSVLNSLRFADADFEVAQQQQPYSHSDTVSHQAPHNVHASPAADGTTTSRAHVHTLPSVAAGSPAASGMEGGGGDEQEAGAFGERKDGEHVPAKDGRSDGASRAREEKREHGKLPLAVAMQKCIVLPVLRQYKEVSAQAVRFMLGDMQLENHLRALRRYFFAEEGLWARGLAKRLFSESDAAAGNLQFVLHEALVESGLASDPFAKRLSLHYGPEPEQERRGDGAAGAPALTGSLSTVKLRYEVAYPLSIIIHPAAQAQYQRVLGFILDIHRTIDMLHDAWLRLKDLSARDKHKQLASHLVACHCVRHHMLHFVTVLHGYLLSQLLHTSWAELIDYLQPPSRFPHPPPESDVRGVSAAGAPPSTTSLSPGKHASAPNSKHDIPRPSRTDGAASLRGRGERPLRAKVASKTRASSVADLHELRARHDGYLLAVTDRALLSPRTSEVLEIIRQALRCIIQFSNLVMEEACAATSAEEVAHITRRVVEIKKLFEHWTGFLHKVIWFMLKKGGARQAHLQDLLIRLDFSAFYANKLNPKV